MSVSAPMPVDVPTGWECPRCRRVYSPQTGQCLPCSPPPALFAGPLPRPEPRRFPHPIGGLPVPLEPIPPEPVPGAENAARRHWEYPVGGPGCPGCAPADDEADRCPECRMPLTMHHDPGCSRPCGRCEERKAEQAEEARRAFRLPEYMLIPGASQIMRVTGAWTEVFPGLEVSLRSVRTGVAEVEFRLAPQRDGQAHD